MENLQNIQVSTLGDVRSSIPRIYSPFDGIQEYHQSRMIEVAGNIANVATSILIDSGVSNSYIVPNIVYRCYMKKSKLELTSLV